MEWQTLLGVTGSGKTFTMANVIEQMNLPTLVVSHNKTLAAQLFGELSGFFPENAVEYFVSYYDYYQPEAYLPARDMFIEKLQTDRKVENMHVKLLRSNGEEFTASLSATAEFDADHNITFITGKIEDVSEQAAQSEEDQEKLRKAQDLLSEISPKKST